VVDLDGRRRRAHFHQFLNQVVRQAVVVHVEGNVIVDVDSGTRPFAQVETLGRQRTQSGLSQGSAYKDGEPDLFVRGRATYKANLNPTIRRARFRASSM
jgi:hypothetical protein